MTQHVRVAAFYESQDRKERSRILGALIRAVVGSAVH